MALLVRPAITPTVARGLVGDARMVCAIGQATERLAAAEKELAAARIADRPVAGLFRQFEQGAALVHRHHVIERDRIGFGLDLIGMSERGVAARLLSVVLQLVLRGAHLARAWRGG